MNENIDDYDLKKKQSGCGYATAIDVVLSEMPTGLSADAQAYFTQSGGMAHILVINAPENAVIGGFEYIHLPFEVDATEQRKGELNAVTTCVSVGDASGTLMEICEATSFFDRCKCELMYVRLSEDYSAEKILSSMFVVNKVGTDGTSFKFEISSDAPFEWQFPPRRMYKAKCQWTFRSDECGYAGADTTCGKTVNDCIAKGNIRRIGCFAGCGYGGLAK